jgi:hypothetical protein
MATEAEERREAVRQSLKDANAVFSWKRIHWLAKSAGFDLTKGAENLGKFANDEVHELNPKDQLKLERFFASETGHVICGKDRKNGTLALLTDLLRRSAKHPDKRDITGWFYAFHGSYIEPGHLVVRAIEIQPKLDGLLHVRNLLRDTHTLHGGILEAFGYLSFVEGKPHMVTYHSDNARGAVLFVGDQLSPVDGKPINKATGQMIGMTKNRQHFYRAMLMLRLSNMPESDILAQTGIFAPDALPQAFQGHFDELKRQLPKEAFRDSLRAPG